MCAVGVWHLDLQCFGKLETFLKFVKAFSLCIYIFCLLKQVCEFAL